MECGLTSDTLLAIWEELRAVSLESQGLLAV